MNKSELVKTCACKGANVMLKEFSFRNCYSFKEETLFSMEANHAMKDNLNFVVTRGETENPVYINPVAAIYGSNAGGKSSILRALNDAVTNIHVGLFLRNNHFYLTSQHDEVFMHKLVVICGNSEYEYQYTATNSEVISETLFLRDVTKKELKKNVFERNGAFIKTMFSIEQAEHQVLLSTASNTGILVMKTAGEIGFALFAPFYKWCGSVASVMRVLGEKERQETLDRYASVLHEDEERRIKFSNFIMNFDKSLYRVTTRMDNTEHDEGDNKEIKRKPRLFIGHKGNGWDEKSNWWLFSIELESNGTKKLMELYPSLTEAIENGTPFICDELDTSLHPLVFKRIVAMFNDKNINKYGAQLIFSAHDTIVMNRECLRRDEIYFADKDKEGKSAIFRLSDVTDEDGNKIRMDARYDRLYIDGILGAVPDGFRSATL